VEEILSSDDRVCRGAFRHVGDSNIAKITSPVLLISGDNDGLDKVELMKTYQLFGGGVAADLAPMPKSHLAIVPSQSHVEPDDADENDIGVYGWVFEVVMPGEQRRRVLYRETLR
jgi:pimeloyl-ACP methyl ester carboxylesterase